MGFKYLFHSILINLILLYSVSYFREWSLAYITLYPHGTLLTNCVSQIFVDC